MEQSHMSAAVLDALQAEFGDAVLVGADIPARNERDWNTLVPVRPLALVRPATPQGVASVLRICSEHKVPVVPQGGLTGLCGGAEPRADWIALSVERLVGIEEVDADSSTMTVFAGTTLETIQKAAEAAGLFFALDLGARGSCSIGGNLSTNAGGNRVIRYGMTRDMVLGIEVALPDGTLLTSLNKMLKNNAGYDLKQLFIGSEGTLGVITRVVLKLFPRPATIMAALCGLPDYAAVTRLLSSARQTLGPILSAFEVMWEDYFNLATRDIPGVRRPIAGEHPFYVLLEAQGNDPASDLDRFEGWLGQLMEEGVVADAAVAQSLSEVTSFWYIRDVASDFVRVTGPHASFDIGLAVGQMDDFVKRCQEALARELPGSRSFYYGHIADGNMHVMASLRGADPQPYKHFDDVIYGLINEFKGTISAEHGIGTKKKQYLKYSRTPEEIGLMGVLKKALDPQGILNPGKIIDAPVSA